MGFFDFFSRKHVHEFVAVEGKCEEECKKCHLRITGNHNWNGCVCTRCGETKHIWKNGKCSKCNIEKEINNPKKTPEKIQTSTISANRSNLSEKNVFNYGTYPLSIGDIVSLFNGKNISDDRRSLIIKGGECRAYFGKFIMVQKSSFGYPIYYVHLATDTIEQAKSIRDKILPNKSIIPSLVYFEIWTVKGDIIGRDKDKDYEDLNFSSDIPILENPNINSANESNTIEPLFACMKLSELSEIMGTFYYFQEKEEAIEAMSFLKETILTENINRNTIYIELFENTGKDQGFQSKYILIIAQAGPYFKIPEIPKYDYIRDSFSSKRIDSFRLVNKLLDSFLIS